MMRPDRSWGVLRNYDHQDPQRRMKETLDGLLAVDGQPYLIACGTPPLMVELEGIPVIHDTDIPDGMVFFHCRSKAILEVDL